ncbi:MAG: hypothetical protein KC912_11115 [Proteobacteria bacterium]|nr:hypothetical protein [Pseudomonadota bacterium]
MRLLLPFVLFGCTPATLLTEEGPQSGYFEVEAETSLEVASVTVGGVPAIYLSQDGETVRFTVQGHAEAGEHDVVFTDAEGEETTLRGGFTYAEGQPGFERMIAMGASLGQGVQGGTPTAHGQLHSPSRFISLGAGAYHPLPVLTPGLFPVITGAEVTAAPDCRPPDVVSFITSSAADVLGALNDEEENQIGFYLGREDPDIEVYNLSVGNTSVTTLLNGPNEDDIAQRFLARLVYDPYGDIADPVPYSQLELAEGLEPTVIVVPDTYGNDLIGSILSNDVPSPGSLDDVEDLRAEMDDLIDALADMGAEVFLSNIPDATLLPATEHKAANARAKGWTEKQVAAALEEIRTIGEGYADALDASAARYDNVHVVDLKSTVEEVRANGLVVDGDTLSVDAYGGLLSADGVHFSDIGYAYEANAFMDAMELVMGVSLERVDLDAVYKTDLHAPQTLVDQGLDEACLPTQLAR